MMTAYNDRSRPKKSAPAWRRGAKDNVNSTTDGTLHFRMAQVKHHIGVWPRWQRDERDVFTMSAAEATADAAAVDVAEALDDAYAADCIAELFRRRTPDLATALAVLAAMTTMQPSLPDAAVTAFIALRALPAKEREAAADEARRRMIAAAEAWAEKLEARVMDYLTGAKPLPPLPAEIVIFALGRVPGDAEDLPRWAREGGRHE
jgi:hypothetical protein